MKDLDIQQVQKDCLSTLSLQTSARVSKDEVTWTRYRDMRNELKSKIKKTKREFYQKALSSSKPREIWQVIHRILHPSFQCVQLAAASFVYSHYADMSDVLKLGWLLTSYRREYHITRTICKVSYQNCWPTAGQLLANCWPTCRTSKGSKIFLWASPWTIDCSWNTTKFCRDAI